MFRALVSITLTFCSLVARGETTTEFLNRFHANPKAVMNEIPAKYMNGQLLSRGYNTRFDREAIDSGRFVNTKVNQTQACRRGDPTEAPVDNANHPRRFFSTPYLTNIAAMATQKLEAGEADVVPWSGDYWPIANGILAARYFDPAFEAAKDWKAKRQYVEEHPVLPIYQGGDQQELNALSTSEKYELLVGDNSGSLSGIMWQQGERYWETDGRVASWMGICHGWAPASYMVPEPKHAIDVASFDGQRKIHFYPAEIKGLASYQWANNSFRTKFISRRCYTEDPAQDENGRIIDAGCFDANPGTWHMVVVNHLGVHKKNFVIDATFDFEVWNQPVYSYSYRYFNPETRESFATLAEAKIAIENYKSDYFAKYRSSQTVNIVGISMKVKYALENSVHQGDVAKPPTLVTAIYRYDLELDAADEILGGEWYTNVHPDFLWTPYDEEEASGHMDKLIDPSLWLDKQQPLPEPWQKAAVLSNPENQLLGTIVNQLIEAAQVPIEN